VFERFTEPARESVAYAQEEARDFRHAVIGTEHLLLGLLREEQGVAARALEALELTLDDTRASVARIGGRGTMPVTDAIPFTEGAKRTLETALRESLNLGQELIGTEHILIALTREPEGVAGQILGEKELDDRLVRGVVAKLIVGPDPARPARGAWEYRVAGFPEANALTTRLLQDWGAERWELVSAFPDGEGLRAIFKRRT